MTSRRSYPPSAGAEHPWDARAAVLRVAEATGATRRPTAAYRRCFAIVDGDGTRHEQCRLLFCDVVGKKVVAVPKALAALRRSVGRLGLSKVERDAVWEVLEHYQKAGSIPPPAVAKVAERALAWRKKYGRGGTAVGIARARDLKNRRPLSPETLRRMRAYLARHAVDKKAPGFYDETAPSAGRIAWDLWGGDAALKWLESLR